MAISRSVVFNRDVQDNIQLEYDRRVFLMNCATGNPTDSEKLAADYINELECKVDDLYKQVNEGK